MKPSNDKLRKQLLLHVPPALREQMWLPEEVDGLRMLDSLFLQAYHAFSSIMRLPGSEYSHAAIEWLGCCGRLLELRYKIERGVYSAEAPPDVEYGLDGVTYWEEGLAMLEAMEGEEEEKIRWRKTG